MSISNVLTTLLNNTEDPAPFHDAADRILTHGNGRRLKKWAQAVTNNPHIDPAQILLRTLIFADAPVILADLCGPESSLFPALFPGCAIGGGFRGTMTSAEWADYIDSNNITFDEEGMPNGVVSTTLDHLTKYLRADLINPTPLLHALTIRVWRDITDDIRETLRATTFIFHTYHFYYIGNDEFSIHRHNRKATLLGVSPTIATDEDWENYNFRYYGGNPEFGIMTRPADFSPGIVVHDRHVYNINGIHITFVDYGDNGVAISTPDALYFLSWPDEYENAVNDIFYDDKEEYDSVC